MLKPWAYIISTRGFEQTYKWGDLYLGGCTQTGKQNKKNVSEQQDKMYSKHELKLTFNLELLTY